MGKSIQKLMAAALTGALCLSLTSTALAVEPRKDIAAPQSSRFATQVVQAQAYGLMSGYGDGQFGETDALNRAMWVTILENMCDGASQTGQGVSFTDVAEKDWFAKGVAWASSKAITSGYPDGSFRATQTLNRQELAVMSLKYAQDQQLGGANSASATVSGYSDAAKVADWASVAYQWCLEQGVLQPDPSGALNPTASITRAESAAAAVALFAMNPIDLDTVKALTTDWSQAAQLPLTGYFTKTVAPGRTVKVYIAQDASVRTYITVVAVPDGVDTQTFLEEEGWFDLMDQKGEALYVLEPGKDGWGTAQEEKDYYEGAITFLKRGANDNNVGVFSTFGEYYLVGYGKGAAPLEAWAAENPIFVTSQVYLDGQGIGQTALAELGKATYDETNTGNYDPIPDFAASLKKAGMTQIARKDVPVPTWFVNYDAKDTSISYWKSANDCVSTAVGGVYHQNINSDAYQTQHANQRLKLDNPGAKYGISQVKVSNAQPDAKELYSFLSTYTRYDNTFAYSNAIAYRLDYTAARVGAQQKARSGAVQATLQSEDGPVYLLSESDVKISGHGTVQVGVFAFRDNNEDGKADPREYLVYIPDGFEGEQQPVLYVYPGNTQSDSIFFDCTQWYQLADREGIVLVLVCETYSAPTALTHVDANYYQTAISAVLEDKIDGTYADLDFTRVYGTGQSLGSMTTQGFARTNPEFFAAVASTSGFRVGEEPVNQAIPSYLMVGQSDLSGEGVNLLPDLWGSENLQIWAEYLFEVNGLDTTIKDFDKQALVGSRYQVYTWHNEDGIPMVQWAQTLLRSHNCYPGEMQQLWDFLQHYSFERAADGSIKRYYSPSAFEKDDAVELK